MIIYISFDKKKVKTTKENYLHKLCVNDKQFPKEKSKENNNFILLMITKKENFETTTITT